MKQVGIPLILTFKLDPKSQAKLDAWRSQYFPPDRNLLKAHLTIYHQLPGQNLKDLITILEKFVLSLTSHKIFFSSIKTRGGFVGVAIESGDLHQTRGQLDLLLGGLLRAQDRKPYKPHVTVTNLGSPKDALKCFQALEADFEPWEGEAVGLELFHYRGGRWEFAYYFPFADPLASL